MLYIVYDVFKWLIRSHFWFWIWKSNHGSLPLSIVFLIYKLSKKWRYCEQTEAALEAGCCPGRTKLVVFYSHEVELVHILVGKYNERLTGTECAVKMLRWGREGSKGSRKGDRECGKGSGRKERTQGDRRATHSPWCKEWSCRKMEAGVAKGVILCMSKDMCLQASLSLKENVC